MLLFAMAVAARMVGLEGRFGKTAEIEETAGLSNTGQQFQMMCDEYVLIT
jgi:hypothetical protein